MDAPEQKDNRITWIEAAIVAVVLAVLAALVVPQFSRADVDSREKDLRAAVQVIQGQVEMYRAQHDSRYPTLAAFTEQMTLSTNRQGQTTEQPRTADYDCGPYLRCIPINPYSGTRDISNTPNGTSAWFYDEQTGQFRPNHAAMQ